MSLATDLHAYLSRHKALATLVAGHIFVGSVPQGTGLPTLVIWQVSGIPDHHTGGANGLMEAHWQCDSYTSTVGLADKVASTLRLALDGLQTAGEFSTVTLDAVQMEGDRMQVTDGRPGEPDYIHQRSIDVAIWYRDIVPTHPAQ